MEPKILRDAIKEMYLRKTWERTPTKKKLEALKEKHYCYHSSAKVQISTTILKSKFLQALHKIEIASGHSGDKNDIFIFHKISELGLLKNCSL